MNVILLHFISRVIITTRMGVITTSAELTKDADKLICRIYKVYLDRRKDFGREKAKEFNNTESLRSSVCPDISLADVNDICNELVKVGYLNGKKDILGIFHISLASEGIIYMENRFPKGVKEVTEHLTGVLGVAIQLLS